MYSDPGIIPKAIDYESRRHKADLEIEEEAKKIMEQRDEVNQKQRIEIEQKLNDQGLDPEEIEFRLERFDKNIRLFTNDYDSAKRQYERIKLGEEIEQAKNSPVPHIFTQRYCRTCLLWRPPKASH